MATTWSLSFASVEQANPAAADLLRLCASCTPDAIPEELLRQGMSQLEPLLQSLGTDDLALHEAVRTLGAYSLLRRDRTSQTLSIHTPGASGAHRRHIQELTRPGSSALPVSCMLRMLRILKAVELRFPLGGVE